MTKYSSIRKFILLFLGLYLFVGTGLAQDESKNDAGPNSYHHHFSCMLLTTYIPKGEKGDKRGLFAPNIGLEYEYEINKKWAVGIIANLELKEYAVNFDDKLVPRENAGMVTLAGFYHITEPVIVFFGPGYEFDKNKDLFIIKAGMKYKFKINKFWYFAPLVELDFKEKYEAASLGISVGRKF